MTWHADPAFPPDGPEGGSTLQPIVIECLAPALDGGRFPVKRIVGDEVEISADIFKDGHDILAAEVLYAAPGERGWRRAPLLYSFDADRWYARVRLDRVGTWRYTVEAWVDQFTTWRTDLEKRVAARQDVASELLEGAEYVHQATPRARGDDFQRLSRWATRLADAAVPQDERITAALEPELQTLMHAYGVRALLSRAAATFPIRVDSRDAGFAAWYEFFPRSTSEAPGRHGTFRDAAAFLRRVAEMGFDVVYLPPIHPIGRTHRKGRNNTLTPGPDDVGSPWAIGNEHGGHDAVAPELGTIDDFDAFVAEAGRLGLEVALDFALQCSPDHPWVKEHPEWFFIRPDGTIKYAENPPKKYQDIYPINFWCEDREGLWCACRDLMLHWVSHGVRTFRVDNPHTKPFAFWEWAIAEVHRRHPDVVFLSEAFTRPKRMKNLAKLGFTQSYTYFTWRNDARELAEYVTELATPPVSDYLRGNFFANTPDILHEYLQRGGRPAFRIRHFLAATLLPVYGIYSGYELAENVPVKEGSEEYLDSEKYQVRQRDWDDPASLAPEIARINRLRRENPALQVADNIRFHPSGNERVLFYTKLSWGNDLVLAATTDWAEPQEAVLELPLAALGFEPGADVTLEDLSTGRRETWEGGVRRVAFDPGPSDGPVGWVWRVLRDADTDAPDERAAPARGARAQAGIPEEEQRRLEDHE
jgi:starch synthase (maltosyl-transferring)